MRGPGRPRSPLGGMVVASPVQHGGVVDLTMSETEIADLLAEPHVGILGIGRRAEQAPVLAPVWYAMLPDGDIVVVTARPSSKVKLLEAGAPVTFLVHSDQLPRHVAVEADITLDEVDEATRRTIAERYVPPDQLDDYLTMTASADVVLVRLRPTRVRSVDLTKASATASDTT